MAKAALRVLVAAAAAACVLSLPILVRGQGNAQPSTPNPVPTVADLARDVRTLEERQKLAIDSIERTYQHTYWFFASIAGIATLLSLFRYLEDRRLLKYQQEQIAEAKELGKSYKTNLDTTIQLMNSVKSVIEFFRSAQEAADAVKGEFPVSMRDCG